MGRRDARGSGRRTPPRPLIQAFGELAHALREGPAWDPTGRRPPPARLRRALDGLARALAVSTRAPSLHLLRLRRDRLEPLARYPRSGAAPDPIPVETTAGLERLVRSGAVLSLRHAGPGPLSGLLPRAGKRGSAPGSRILLAPIFIGPDPGGAIALVGAAGSGSIPRAVRDEICAAADMLGPLLAGASSSARPARESDRWPGLLEGGHAQLLEKIVDASVDAIVAADRRGTIVLFNAGAERISGYRAEEVIGKLNVEALYAPNVAHEIMRRLRSPGFGGRGKLLDSVEALRTKDGREIPIHISAAILYENGAEQATVGVFTDLRDLLRLEKGIRESEELHRMVVEQAEAGIGIVQRGRLRFANRRLREILQIPPGERRDVPLTGFLDPALLRTLGLLPGSRGASRGAGGRVEAEVEIEGRLGARRSVEILVGPVLYRGTPARQIHMRDISKRRELEQTYRVLVDTAARARQGIILVRETLDEPAAVIFANEEFCRITGWPLEQLRKIPLSRLFAPEGLRTATRVYESLLRGDALDEPTRVLLRTRAGDPIIVETSTARTTYRGRPALIGYCRDVTAHARMEAMLDEQSRALAEKNQSLEEILSRLRSTQQSLIEQQKLAELGTFSAGIAHEIRNPLGLIRSHLRTLEESKDPKARARALSGIERQISRSSDFIDKLLSYARPTAPVRRRLDLNRTMSMAARFAEEALAPPRSVKIQREFASELPAVMGDHTQLQEVFINLITNALQAVGRWGTIRLLTARQGPKRLRAEVSDSGPGIEEEALEQVFRPFYTSGKGPKGTGMGLAIARRIVEAHEGEILALRNRGGGMTFRVLLPAEGPGDR